MSLYKFIHETRINQIIDNKSIRFTQPDEWNDPFEMKPTFYNPSIEFVGEIFRKDFIRIEDIYEYVNHNFVSLSLTENKSNLLMWAHYSNNHKGVLFEFDETTDFFTDKRKLLFKIPYSNIRPVLNKSDVTNICSDLLDHLREGKAIDELVLQKFSVIFHKSIEWKDEQEWRLITLSDFADELKFISKNKRTYYSKSIDNPAKNKIISDYVALFHLPNISIKSIVLGCNVSRRLRNKIVSLKEIPEYSHLKIYHSDLDKREYKLVYTEIGK